MALPFKTKRKKQILFTTTEKPQGEGGTLSTSFRTALVAGGGNPQSIGTVKLLIRPNSVEIIEQSTRIHYLVEVIDGKYQVSILTRKGGSSELRKTNKKEKAFLKSFRLYMKPWEFSRKEMVSWEKGALAWFKSKINSAVMPKAEEYAKQAMMASLPPIYKQAIESSGQSVPQLTATTPFAALPFTPVCD